MTKTYRDFYDPLTARPVFKIPDSPENRHCTEVPATALQTQVGGAHYSNMAIQPITYILANDIPFAEGNVIKYVSRWRAKGGVKDLEKAVHQLRILIEHEEAIKA